MSTLAVVEDVLRQARIPLTALLRELAREVYEAKPQQRGGWKWTPQQLRARTIRRRA